MTKWMFLGVMGVGLGAGNASMAAEPSTEMVEVDLTKALAEAGRATKGRVVIKAPAGAKVAESYGDVSVATEDGFHLVVVAEPHDIAKDRAYQTENAVQKHKRFVVDTSEAIIGESQMMQRVSFYLTANHRAGKETFGCQSKRGAVSFTEEQTQAMLASCNSIQVKKK